MEIGTVRFAVAGAGLLAARKWLRARNSISFQDRVILITGSSRGLGLAIARRFAREKAKISIVARTEEDLEAAAKELSAMGAQVLTQPRDLRNREEVEAAVAKTVERFGRLDVVINNAGIIQVGPFEHMEQADYEEAMDLHFWAAHFAIQAAVPHLRFSGRGRIVNITSFAGRVAVPHLLPYTASKFATAGYSDGIRSEMAKHGIRVTTVVPGLMRTGSHVNALFKGRNEQEYAWFSSFAGIPLFSTTAENAARRIVEACRFGQSNLVLTVPAKIAVVLNGVMPGLVAFATEITDRLLPGVTAGGDEPHTGWESTSELSPSVLSAAADKQIPRQNQPKKTTSRK